ncbi:stringent starvation protein B [Andreprevotia lacus DSM 23236]|jgi:stringent starvation protein B|uniref:Stringent starvation protein B n=1 Tax=Andreprevotia lacus DSM 23236 TaxID=1121001 RepID=A0A1W1XTP4_9NEIS|nr:ClpXP protease specificity-enhancing factor [Andreprevotia lacus]SMC26888.1 stringent starvation protein B [Andreprevotia lacus DSM 23236]
MQSVSTKPYLIRALHEWCSDHGFTPYLVVSVRGKMQVPMEYVKNGEIVLNISYNATRNLSLGNDYISFSARFNGVSRDISIPVGAVVSIFSRENGEGMGFEYEESPADASALETAPESKPDDDSNEPPPGGRPGGKPALRIVK